MFSLLSASHPPPSLTFPAFTLILPLCCPQLLLTASVSKVLLAQATRILGFVGQLRVCKALLCSPAVQGKVAHVSPSLVLCSQQCNISFWLKVEHTERVSLPHWLWLLRMNRTEVKFHSTFCLDCSWTMSLWLRDERSTSFSTRHPHRCLLGKTRL